MKRRRPFKSRLRNAFLTASGILGLGTGGILIEQLPKDPVTDTQIITTYNMGTPQQHGYNISFVDQFWKQSLLLKGHDALVNDMLSAASSGDSWRVRAVLENGGIDLQKDAGAALVEATRAGHMDVIETLLNAGVKANALNDAPFIAAMESGNYPLALRYADLAAPASTNLHRGAVIAAGMGSLEMLESLVTRGVDITAENNSILVAAASGGHLQIISRLLQEKTTETVVEYIPAAGITPFYDNSFYDDAFKGGCVLFPMEDYSLHGDYEHAPPPQRVVTTVEKYKVDLDANHAMPLKMAAINGQEEAVRALIDAGADIRIAGAEILSNAVLSQNAKLVAYLLAQPGITADNAATGFRQAVELNNHDMARAFMLVKADNTQVLKLAEQRGDVEMINILKGQDAPKDQTPRFPFSPRSLL